MLLVDNDSQANASKVLITDYLKLKREEPIYTTILLRQPLLIHLTQVPNLNIVASHILPSNTNIELTTTKDHREARMKSQFDLA